MNNILKVLCFGSLVFFLQAPKVFSQGKIYTLNINNPSEMRDYFKYSPEDLPIVSGHRGGTMKGYPENCISTFEYTLKYAPAFFEIDPRLTKDGLVVLMHDETIDRTTNGSGKVSDYTYKELLQFRLKDLEGNITSNQIPLLKDVIIWSKGKTVLNLDHKDVPFNLTQKIIQETGNRVIMITVHNPDQAKLYLQDNPDYMFSAHILNLKTFNAYEKAGIPWANMIAYIGPRNKPENKVLLDMLHAKGVKCMISAAPSYDMLSNPVERAENYRDTFKQGADILESDLPVEVIIALKSLPKHENPKKKYIKKENLN